MSPSCLFLAERLLKMSLEELREFLQERIAQTFFHSDDLIIEQLQVSMMELRKMKLDLPPPGTALHLKVLQLHLRLSHLFVRSVSRETRRAASEASGPGAAGSARPGPAVLSHWVPQSRPESPHHVPSAGLHFPRPEPLQGPQGSGCAGGAGGPAALSRPHHHPQPGASHT